MVKHKTNLILFIYIILLSFFLIFIGQVLYSLLITDITLPDDWCTEFVEIGDEETGSKDCVKYKSKYIHALETIDGQNFHRENHYQRKIIITLIIFLLGFLINYFFIKSGAISLTGIKGFEREISDITLVTILSSLILPILILILSSLFLPRHEYYKFLVPKSIRELGEARINEAQDEALGMIKDHPEYYKNDPY